jgi:FAD/FMN-containing dehydrogenase
MNRVREVDPLNFSMIVEAGCLLADVQIAATNADRFFPLALGSQGSCQIGGNIATNAGGLAAVHYGVTRDLVLGLEVVLADGRVLDGLTSLRKDNTGYNLRDLFVAPKARSVSSRPRVSNSFRDCKPSRRRSSPCRMRPPLSSFWVECAQRRVTA